MKIDRRQAIHLMGASASLGLYRITALAQVGDLPTTGLGIVVYALGNRRRAMEEAGETTDLFEPLRFLEYCHGLGAGGVQVPLGIRDAAYCRRLREIAERFGMFIEGNVRPPFDDSDVERFEREIRTAREVGANVVRTVILPGRRYERFASLDEYRGYAARGRRALERAAPIVEREGIRLAIENHKDQRIEERVALLRHIDSEHVGVCMDMGNSFALLEDPMEVVKAYAPWAYSCHLKDQAVQENETGFLFADVPLGAGILPLKEMVNVLRDANADIHFSLEMITRDPLDVPCLAESYWRTLSSGVPATDLARTLRTVRANEAERLPDVGSFSIARRADQEHQNVMACLNYAREELGI